MMAAGRLPRALAGDAEKPSPRKTALSFYCDDTNPYVTGAKPFRAFLDYCAAHGIAGESTAILGTSGHSMCRNPDEEEAEFLRQVARAWKCGIGTHMELMTHRGLFDFDANHERKDAPHEGLWLHEPKVTVGQYERILRQHHRRGLPSGREVHRPHLAWLCLRGLHAPLRGTAPGGHKDPNPAMWIALLNLARQGKFRGRTVPCFFGASETEYGIRRKAADGRHAVYELMPNAMDWFGSWDNNPARVDPNYYITADGKSGIVVRHVQARALTASGTRIGKGSIRQKESAGERSRRWWSGSASTLAAVSSGCGPARSPTAITRPAAGPSWRRSSKRDRFRMTHVV